MEWWHIGPLVLAVLVFLLAGTVIERHVETAVLHFVNRHPPQSQATVAVETSDGQDLQQQQDDWLQQQLLKKKEELEQQELLLQKLQQQELQKGQRLQQQEAQQQHELLDRQLLRKQAEFPTLLEKQHTETLQEVKPSEKKSLPNPSVNRQFSASQAAWKPIVTSSQLQQEPQLVPSKQRQQSLHQQPVQPIKQQSLQQAVQPIKQQSSQQQQAMQQQQRQGLLMKQQSQQHSDTQPPLPFVAVSEKSILQPTSKTTVGSKAMDMQFNPKP